jgi:hypothetical protein
VGFHVTIAAFGSVSPAAFLISVLIAAALAMLVFSHASKHGSGHATAWGVATFLFAGIAVPVYFIRYWLTRSGRTGRRY